MRTVFVQEAQYMVAAAALPCVDMVCVVEHHEPAWRFERRVRPPRRAAVATVFGKQNAVSGIEQIMSNVLALPDVLAVAMKQNDDGGIRVRRRCVAAHQLDTVDGSQADVADASIALRRTRG